MDIKTTRPKLTQETDAALDQKSGPSSGALSFMSQFVIRTMASDLKNHLQPASGPAPIHAPTSLVSATQTTPKIIEPVVRKINKAEELTKSMAVEQKKAADDKKKQEEQKQNASKEAAARQAKEQAENEKQKIVAAQTAQKQEITRFFKQAELKLAAKEFGAAIIDAQKIINSSNAGWLEKWRASRFINKAQKSLRQENLSSELKKGAAQSIQPAISKPAAPATSTATPISITPVMPASAAPTVPLDLPIIEEMPRPVTDTLSFKEPKLFIGTKPEPPKIPVPNPVALTPPKIATGLMPEEPKEEGEALDIKKILLVGLSSIAVLVLIVGGIWFLLNSPAQQTTQISQTPVPSQASATPSPTGAPSAIFEADDQKVFTLKDGQEKANLQEILFQMTETEELIGNFIHIAFKNSRGELLSLDKLTPIIGTDFFDLPTQTSAGNLKNQLNMALSSFFTYSQSSSQISDSPFNPSLTNLGRLGLAITISAASTDEFAKSLKDLEQLMLNGLSVLLPSAKNNFPANPVFSDSTHSGVAIRYVNLPNSNLSLDYAILNDKLIFTTSKESMFAIIDRILSPNGQLNRP